MIPLPFLGSADTAIDTPIRNHEFQIVSTQTKYIAGDINLPISDSSRENLITFFISKNRDIENNRKSNIFSIIKDLIITINKNEIYSTYPEANSISLNIALKAIPILNRLKLIPLNPQRTADGGILLEFPIKYNLTFIEFGNDDQNCFGVLNEENKEIFIDFSLENLENLLENHLLQVH